jgi:hypothetical protein
MEADPPSRVLYLAEAYRLRSLADKTHDKDLRGELLVIAEIHEELAAGVSRATSTLLN